MRIVIDLQGAQTASRFQGVGRCSLSLALAMAQNAGSHEIWLALNGAFYESILNIRNVFDGLIPQERIVVFDVPTPVAESNPANGWRTRVAKKIRERFLCQLSPDVIHVSSLFEGWEDDAVTSVGAFASGENTVVSLCDLIPLHDQKSSGLTAAKRDYYFRKAYSLKNAGLVIALSERLRREAIDMLALPEERIVNIQAAIESIFHPAVLPEEQIHQLRSRFGVHRKMITCVPAGIEVCRDVGGLIRAYASLPSQLRAEYQLVIAGGLTDVEHVSMERVRKQAQLAQDELVLTGYVSDDNLAALYNLTSLFVWPSNQDVFGLPALEAMACGAPTIGSNTANMLELIGLNEALFDRASVQSMAQKMAQALKDDDLRSRLRDHGLEQVKKLSWDVSAKRAIAAFEALCFQKKQEKAVIVSSTRRPKLAYVSPLPPERSGISDYSAALLPELSRHYDVEVIVNQYTVSEPWVNANHPVRSVQWFQRNAYRYERILYHFGNSPFHSHMFGLLRQYPGVVVLHDFFLSGVLAHEEISGAMDGAWANALYYSHGYRALLERCADSGFAIAQENYPCNLEVLQNARGIIVHSGYSKRLAQHWYSPQAADGWQVIPSLRTPCRATNRSIARRSLGIGEDFFVVSNFGFIGPTKCNHRLVEAWVASRLVTDPRCLLIFVGESPVSQYGQRLLKVIERDNLKNRINITGWTDSDTYANHLAAADVGVQLRTLSRGETSAALLDCMNYGLATIVNAHGSAEELPRDAVWMLPDEFTDAELVDALETLWQDDVRRRELGRRAQEEIRVNHNPRLCADRYAEAIEAIYQRSSIDMHALVEAIAALNDEPVEDSSVEVVAKSIAISSAPQPAQRQLLVDVSAIARNDLKTGIERVVHAQLSELIKHPPEGFRVEPVYLTDQGGQWHYRYARSYTCKKFGIEYVHLPDVPIDIGPGDIFYAADFCPGGVIEAAKSNVYSKWKAAGVSINVLVFDLLPILRPEFFPEGANITHELWLKTVAEFASRLLCISNAVADDLRSWLKRNPPARKDSLVIDAIPLGADITSLPSIDLSGDSEDILPHKAAGPTFLMVGTIEPRKGYLQIIEAFEQLWQEGSQANLVVVGKEGWTHLADSQRRTIPEIVNRLRKHHELGKRLFWLEGISDGVLLKLYKRADALLMASEGEGFGLPLVEAAQYGLPIIARDLPVFREVAGDNAYYFAGCEPESLADSLKDWLLLKSRGDAPESKEMSWLTWAQSARRLIEIVLPDRINRVNEAAKSCNESCCSVQS